MNIPYFALIFHIHPRIGIYRFSQCAAIITDIGAPLSHAAIACRELGIPHVVGCENVTTRLKTGDRVLADGGQGIVQIPE